MWNKCIKNYFYLYVGLLNKNYVCNTCQFIVKVKSCDYTEFQRIDSILFELTQFNVTVCCMYCPSGISKNDILLLTERHKDASNRLLSFILSGNFNINLLDQDSDISTDFINDLHSLSLLL